MLSPDFKLSRLYFETRYAPAYSLWDSAGALAQRVASLKPELQIVAAQPAEIEFRGENSSLKCGLRSTHLGAKKIVTSAEVEERGKFASEVLAVVNEVLHISQYIRVGCRCVFVRTFSTALDASQFVKGTGLLKLPTAIEERLATDFEIREPSLAFRLDEKQTGTMFRLQASSQTVELDADFDLADEVPKFEGIFHRVVLDADRYTIGTLPTGKVDAGQWIKASFRAIVRDGQRLLGANA